MDPRFIRREHSILKGNARQPIIWRMLFENCMKMTKFLSERAYPLGRDIAHPHGFPCHCRQVRKVPKAAKICDFAALYFQVLYFRGITGDAATC